MSDLVQRMNLRLPAPAICSRDRAPLRTALGARGVLRMQSDTPGRPEDGNDEERARLEEERAKLGHMFNLGSPDASTPLPDVAAQDAAGDVSGGGSVPGEDGTMSGNIPPADVTDREPAADADAVARLNSILAEGGSEAQVVPQAQGGFATDVSLGEARRRVEAEGGKVDAGGDVGQVADTMGQGMAQSHAAIISALLSGYRSLIINVNVPELDPSSRGYNETALYAWSQSIATSLSTLSASDSPVKVIVQDDDAAVVAERAFSGCDRTQIRTLAEAKDGVDIVSEDDAAVLMVAPTNSKGCRVTKEVRQAILQNKGKPIVVLNHCLDAAGPDGKPVGSLPVEMKRFEEAYYIQVGCRRSRQRPCTRANERLRSLPGRGAAPGLTHRARHLPVLARAGDACWLCPRADAPGCSIYSRLELTPVYAPRLVPCRLPQAWVLQGQVQQRKATSAVPPEVCAALELASWSSVRREPNPPTPILKRRSAIFAPTYPPPKPP